MQYPSFCNECQFKGRMTHIVNAPGSGAYHPRSFALGNGLRKSQSPSTKTTSHPKTRSTASGMHGLWDLYGLPPVLKRPYP